MSELKSLVGRYATQTTSSIVSTQPKKSKGSLELTPTHLKIRMQEASLVYQGIESF